MNSPMNIGVYLELVHATVMLNHWSVNNKISRLSRLSDYSLLSRCPPLILKVSFLLKKFSNNQPDMLDLMSSKSPQEMLKRSSRNHPQSRKSYSSQIRRVSLLSTRLSPSASKKNSSSVSSEVMRRTWPRSTAPNLSPPLLLWRLTRISQKFSRENWSTSRSSNSLMFTQRPSCPEVALPLILPPQNPGSLKSSRSSTDSPQMIFVPNRRVYSALSFSAKENQNKVWLKPWNNLIVSTIARSREEVSSSSCGLIRPSKQSGLRCSRIREILKLSSLIRAPERDTLCTRDHSNSAICKRLSRRLLEVTLDSTELRTTSPILLSEKSEESIGKFIIL